MTEGAQWLIQSATTRLDEVRVATLILLLTVAAAIDLRQMRVPNWLTVCGAVIGVALGAAIPWHALGARWVVEGALWSVGGLGLGLVLMLPLYALHVMGAGDVKLMAMVGSYVGLQQVLPTVLCVFVAGGLLGVGWALWRGVFRRAGAHTGQIAVGIGMALLSGTPASAAVPASVGKLPYALSIAVGTLAWLLIAHFRAT